MSSCDDTVTHLRLAEYVVGLLDDPERAELEGEMAEDGALARQLARWEEGLIPLAERLPEREPSSLLWQRIKHLTASAASAEASQRAVGYTEASRARRASA